MKKTSRQSNRAHRHQFAFRFAGSLMPVLFLLMLCGKGWAQAPTTAASGFTPEGLKTGAPAGSFQLSGFDNINYFNGNLNFNLPLLQVGGRGKTGYTIPLKIENKWLVKKTPSIADFVDTPEPNSWQKVVTPGYGPGVLIGRVVGALGQNCGQAGSPITYTLTRLTFTAGDGTEYQLRDTTFRNGLDFETTWSDCNVGITLNRGKHFVGDDGSGVTFVSDEDIFDAYNGAQTEQIAPSGYLMLPDGTRYRIEDGIVRWMRDRNGNKMSFGYASGDLALITDSLNRQVTISLFDAAQSRFYDEITYKGFGGADRKIRVGYKLLSQVLISGQTMSFHALFPELSLTSVTMTIFDQWVPSSVDLPDGRSYQFKYNAYGELARVELPTGGAIEYDYLEGLVDNTPLTGSGVYPPETGEFVPHQIYRRVSQRRVYADKNSTVFEHQMTISRPEGLTAEQNLGYVDVETWAYPGKDAGGALLSKERHYYYGSAKVSPTQEPINYSEWKTGKEWKTEVFAADGVTVINRVENTWQQPQDGFSWPLTAPETPETNDAARPNNPKITQTIKVLAETNQVSKQTFAYDKHFNQTDVYEYDFGAGSVPAIPTRHSRTNFLTLNPVNGINYADPANVAVGYTLSDYHIRNLPENQIAYSVHPATGAETVVARTDYEYDRYDTNHHAALMPRSNISGLCNNTSLNCPNGPDFTNPGYQIRGNVTEVKRYSNAASLTGAITTYQQYDVAGNVVKAIDAGRADGTRSTTIVDYDDRFGTPDVEVQSNTRPTELGTTLQTFAFVTKVTNQLNHTAHTQFDFYLGKPVNTEDANGVVSSIFYADDLDRPTAGIRAVGSPVANQVVFFYNDSNSTVNDNPPHSITTIGDINTFGQSSNGNGMKSLALYDGLGRTWRSAVYEITPESDNVNKWAITQTKFDALGRTWKVSNPFRLLAADGQEGTLEWTTTTYDALSRVTEVMTPDGAKVKTIYSGSTVTVTDQDNKSRSSLTDAFGRLMRVIEDPGAGKLNYRTDYTYDALDNLTKVRQGGVPLSSGGNVIQTRTFLYDSLSRLLYANNPEQDATIQGPSGTYWTMKYGYDPNGNLTSRTDARNIIATYSYDALNRNTQVSYSDNKTPTVTRFYDSAPNGKGRLQRVATENLDPRNNGQIAHSQTIINNYDAVGRVTSQTQRFLRGTPTNQMPADYTTTRTYDLAGHVKHQNYPFAGRYVDYEYNDGGRLKHFTGNLMGFGSPTYYATSVDNSGIRYNAAGQMLYEVFGTSPSLLAHRVNYNNRFQMIETKLGTDVSINDSSASSTWTRGKLKFDYGTTDNNGNVRWQEHLVPTSVNSGSAPTIPDSVNESVIPMRDEYLYDELNRITKVTGNKVVGSTTTQIYTQGYSYDRFGNRKINAAQTSGTGVNKRVYNPNPLNNRLRELAYDKAGNVLSETLYGSRAEVREYDAENRMTRAVSSNGAQQNYYVYDGDGRRVRRIVGNEETWQVYGIDGELLAEYKLLNGAPETTPSKEYGYRNGQLLIVGDKAESKVWWLVTDHLGTPRIEVDQTGALTSSSLKRHDYLPFGEEVKVGVGTGSIRTTGMGYEMGQVVGARRQKFTGKERDTETELDYFGARYYSSINGRWLSPDWSEMPEPVPYANLTNPQSLNLFSYVGNNPVTDFDEDGHQGRVEKIKNLILGNGYQTDQEVETERYRKKDEEFRRVYAELKKLGATDDFLGQLTAQQQSDLYQAIQRGDNSVTSGGVTINIITPSPALTGDPYHPDVVKKRQNDNAPWRAAEARKEAQRLGNELLGKYKQTGIGQASGRSGGHGEAFRKAGNELIQRANKIVDNPELKEALKIEGKRLLNQAKGHSHKN